MPQGKLLMDKQTASLSRKGFLKLLALTGTVGAAFKMGLQHLRQPHVTTESQILMGTLINLTLVGPNPKASQEAIQACFNKMRGLEEVLSRYQPESDVSLLNAQGRLDQPHPALLKIIRQSIQLSQMSHGAFDITVKPLLDYYQDVYRQREPLSSHEVQCILPLVDCQRIYLEGPRIRFDKPEMAITLDGIAKGYIVDQGIHILGEHGLSHILVEAGGDLYANDSRYDDQPWEIGIRDPRPENGREYLTSIPIKGQAVATSGDYARTFSADYQTNHILDPRTGISPAEVASATILAPTTALADALGTTVMVLGIEKGLEFIQSMKDCQACLISKEMEVFTTSGFPQLSTY
jgi:thiamine biosynthesis lipoprotein